VEVLLQDVRFAVRRLASHKATTAVLVAILGLGIGATTCGFSLLDKLLLHPIALKNLERLVSIRGAASPPQGDPVSWWNRSAAFTGIAEQNIGTANLARGAEIRPVVATVVSANFFSVLEVNPQIGRTFVDGDEMPGLNHVAVLSEGLWRDAFGGDSRTVGSTIVLNGAEYTVVGVMPQGFDYPRRTEIWACRARGGYRSLQSLDLGAAPSSEFPSQLSIQGLIGRLRPGYTPEAARTELRTMLEQLKRQDAKNPLRFGSEVSVVPLEEVLVRNSRPGVLLLFASSLFLLLIALVNSANLLLVQAVEREKEIAIRLVNGASRARLFRQMLTESMLLALAGGSLGILLARWGMGIARGTLLVAAPSLADVPISGTALGFAVSATIGVGLLLGCAPAINAWKSNAAALGKEGYRPTKGIGRRLRQGFVLAQLGLALALLVGASLTMQSFFHLMAVEPGFDARNALTVKLLLPQSRYGDLAKVEAFHRTVSERLESLPGVEAVASTDSLPFSGDVRGSQCVDAAERICPSMAQIVTVGGDYFRAMRIPLRYGRSFRLDGSAEGPKTAVVSETLAHRFWGSKNPVGQTLQIEGEYVNREIVGVAGDVHFSSLDEENGPQLYLPLTQPYRGHASGSLALVIRSASDPGALAKAVTQVLATVDTTLAPSEVQSLDERVTQSTGSIRLRASLLVVFAVLAVMLATLGVYGVVAHLTAGRTHEIAVRMALGAEPKRINRMILGEAAKLGVFGIATGLGLAFWLTRFISNLLFRVSAFDPLTFGGSATLVLVVTLGASYFPARRASRIEPAEALRHE
jgi:putative ABC transport system permease protein